VDLPKVYRNSNITMLKGRWKDKWTSKHEPEESPYRGTYWVSKC